MRVIKMRLIGIGINRDYQKSRLKLSYTYVLDFEKEQRSGEVWIREIF